MTAQYVVVGLDVASNVQITSCFVKFTILLGTGTTVRSININLRHVLEISLATYESSVYKISQTPPSCAIGILQYSSR